MRPARQTSSRPAGTASAAIVTSLPATVTETGEPFRRAESARASSDGSPITRGNREAAAADRYLAKPFSPLELISLVEELLEGGRAPLAR
jgi:CheY-like chemotaxis protein